jgi:hypothetical protein
MVDNKDDVIIKDSIIFLFSSFLLSSRTGVFLSITMMHLQTNNKSTQEFLFCISFTYTHLITNYF